MDFIVGSKAINVTLTDGIPKRELEGLNQFLKSHRSFELVLITKSVTKGSMVSISNFLTSGQV